MKKILLAGLALAATCVLVSAPAAQANGDRNGRCENGDLCLRYNSNNAGPWMDYWTQDMSHHDDKFFSSYDANGNAVKSNITVGNNAAWAKNHTSPGGYYARICYNSNLGGDCWNLAPGASANLPSWLKNNNASNTWVN
ncbi:hypothetical protein [Streptomyces niveus]|uniref:hypothetical protein n=1 Tax=Streptomyces niveus TaxID=193462 RepID=UPI0036A9CFB1